MAICAEPEALADTFARNERYAVRGEPGFWTRCGEICQHLGDPAHGPNPCLGPMGAGPCYALEIRLADVGTSIGFETDAVARVPSVKGAPIEGLYAAGNDMASVMGGTYPGPGMAIGPALTFLYVAACHAALRKETNNELAW